MSLEKQIQKSYPEKELNAQLPVELMKLRAAYSIDGEFLLNPNIFDRNTVAGKYTYAGREDGQFAEVSRRISQILHYKNLTDDKLEKKHIERASNCFVEQITLLLSTKQSQSIIDGMANNESEIYDQYFQLYGKSDESWDQLDAYLDILRKDKLDQAKIKLLQLYTLSHNSRKRSDTQCFEMFDTLLVQAFGHSIQAQNTTQIKYVDKLYISGSCSSAELAYYHSFDQNDITRKIQMLVDSDTVYAIRKYSGDTTNALLIRPLQIGSVVYPAGTLCKIALKDSSTDITRLDKEFAPVLELRDFVLEMLKLTTFSLPSNEQALNLADNKYFHGHGLDHLMGVTIEDLRNQVDTRYQSIQNEAILLY